MELHPLSSSFVQNLLETMEEVVAIERGRAKSAQVIRVSLTTRKTTAMPAPHFDAMHIKQVRTKLKLSQPVFARALNVNPGTVRASEQGATTPSDPALRLLKIAERDPRVVLRDVPLFPFVYFFSNGANRK
jgi:putative transcriptional regulator